MIGDTMVLSDKAANQWYVGKGPLSLLDLTAGTIRWTIPCDQTGYLMMDRARLLSGDRLLIAGAKNCDLKSDRDATKEPQYSMINTATGGFMWHYETKSLEYDNALGYWARAAQFPGAQVQKDKRQQLITMLVTPKGEFDETGIYEPDRLAVVGEQWECVRLSDGVPPSRRRTNSGSSAARTTGRRSSATRTRSTRTRSHGAAPIWTFDLKGKGVTVYTADDLIDQGDGVPDGMSDILVSEPDIVSRVDIETGRAAWTVSAAG